MESALYGIYALIAHVSEIERVKAAHLFSVSVRFFFFFFNCHRPFYNSSGILKAKHDLASHWLGKKKM